MAERFAPPEPEPAPAPPPPDTPAFLSGKKLIEDLGPDADRIARYCEGLTYPMDVWNGRNPARTAFCPIWIEWRAAADAHDTHMQAIVAYRRQCRPASVARSWISYDPIDIAVRWPVIAIHAVRGGSYHSWRCGRIRDNLQSMTNGHLEKNVTGLARSVHDALFVQNVIQHFK